MGRSTRVVNMSVDESLYEGVDRLAREKGTSRSQVLREALRQYVAAETRWSELLRWGEESAVRMGGLDESDVERIIHEYREERR
jgi:metal-responsive CopG/Arc/MetJ family transcriptional regulator